MRKKAKPALSFLVRAKSNSDHFLEGKIYLCVNEFLALGSVKMLVLYGEDNCKYNRSALAFEEVKDVQETSITN